MKKINYSISSIVFLLILVSQTLPQNRYLVFENQTIYSPSKQKLDSDHTSSYFIENVGQFPEEVLYKAVTADSILWITEDSMWVTVMKNTLSEPNQIQNFSEDKIANKDIEQPKGVNLKLFFPDSNAHPKIRSFVRLNPSINYLIGKDKASWH
ncbi:MAG: hypothetical protein AAGU75_21675, partial [Bacillota bacterium]